MNSATPPTPSSRKPNTGGPGSSGGSAGRRIPNAAPSPASADQRFSRSAFAAPPQIDGRTPQPEGQANTIDFSQAAQASGNTPKQQARMLGNLIGNQQADARMNSLNENGGGRSESDSNYPPSVLDAMNSKKGVPPTESMFADDDGEEGGEADSEASRNAAFQQQQRAGADNQAHFLQSGDGYDEGTSDSDDGYGYEDGAGAGVDDSAYEDPEPSYQPSRAYQSTPNTAGRLSGMLQQPEANEEDEDEEELEAKNASQQGAPARSPLKEMASRETRIALAATGIGTPIALLWIVGKLGKNFFADADKKAPPMETFRDFSEAGTILMEAVVGIFMLFIESLPILVPFVIAVSGVALATQYFGPEIADLATQLAN